MAAGLFLFRKPLVFAAGLLRARIAMIWFTIFLLGTLCAMICAAALVAIWLGVATLGGFLTSVERAFTNFADGHAIVALLYLIPAALFLCAISEGLYLAYSFITTVLR